MTREEAEKIMMNTPIQVERKGDTIKVSKEFPSLIGSKWYSIERTIMERDDDIHELIALEQKLDEANKLFQLSLDKEWKYATSINQFIPAEFSTKPLVINREYERKAIEIENVSSLEELAQFKEYCGKNPDLMSCYTSKLRDLTNKISTP